MAIESKIIAEILGQIKRGKLPTNGELIGKQISETQAKTLAEALEKQTIPSLNVRNNQIQDKGAEAFAHLLLINTSITAFDLSENGLTTDGALAMATVITVNEQLITFSLAANNIGPQGGEAIGKALIDNKTLQTLNLENCKIGDGSAIEIAQALLKKNEDGSPFSALKEINLANCEIGALGTAKLALAFWKNTTLRSVNLSHNPDMQEKIGSITAVLSMAGNTITAFNFGHNNIKNFGANAFADVLKVNTKLTALDLSANGITSEGASEIAAALLINKTLKALDLRDNPDIGEVGFSNLAEAIRKNKMLTSFKLTVDPALAASEGFKDLMAAIRDNFTLLECEIICEGVEQKAIADEVSTYIARNISKSLGELAAGAAAAPDTVPAKVPELIKASSASVPSSDPKRKAEEQTEQLPQELAWKLEQAQIDQAMQESIKSAKLEDKTLISALNAIEACLDQYRKDNKILGRDVASDKQIEAFAALKAELKQVSQLSYYTTRELIMKGIPEFIGEFNQHIENMNKWVTILPTLPPDAIKAIEAAIKEIKDRILALFKNAPFESAREAIIGIRDSTLNVAFLKALENFADLVESYAGSKGKQSGNSSSGFDNFMLPLLMAPGNSPQSTSSAAANASSSSSAIASSASTSATSADFASASAPSAANSAAANTFSESSAKDRIGIYDDQENRDRLYKILPGMGVISAGKSYRDGRSLLDSIAQELVRMGIKIPDDSNQPNHESLHRYFNSTWEILPLGQYLPDDFIEFGRVVCSAFAVNLCVVGLPCHSKPSIEKTIIEENGNHNIYLVEYPRVCDPNKTIFLAQHEKFYVPCIVRTWSNASSEIPGEKLSSSSASASASSAVGSAAIPLLFSPGYTTFSNPRNGDREGLFDIYTNRDEMNVLLSRQGLQAGKSYRDDRSLLDSIVQELLRMGKKMPDATEDEADEQDQEQEQNSGNEPNFNALLSYCINTLDTIQEGQKLPDNFESFAKFICLTFDVHMLIKTLPFKKQSGTQRMINFDECVTYPFDQVLKYDPSKTITVALFDEFYVPCSILGKKPEAEVHPRPAATVASAVSSFPRPFD